MRKKPRRLQRATGTLLRAAFRIHLRLKSKNSDHPDGCSEFLVGEGGFEPPKSLTTDLQSAPFGHSGIPPYSLCCTHFETQRSGFKMKRRKAIADMELFASAESGMEQASFDGGAGRRIRTPDLLITKMRLYVYCVHFVPISPDTSNL